MSSLTSKVKPKLLDQVREKIRLRNYAYSTEKTYIHWIKRYIFFHNKQHPADLGKAEVEAFLMDLAVKGNVAASTQNQALSALLFLYSAVLENPLGYVDVLWTKKPKRLPVVLTKKEVHQVLTELDGIPLLIAKMLYGGGLRLNECLKIRIKDVDFGQQLIIIRDGKGQKDRTTTLPQSIQPELQKHIKSVARLHHQDLQNGNGRAPLPKALNRKYPNAEKEWQWQFLFPSRTLLQNPRGDNTLYRFHLHASTIQRRVKRVAGNAGISKHVTPHIFRHTFATHLLEKGIDIRTIQTLLGHKNLNTTMIYTHVVNQGAIGVRSPLDELDYSPS